MKGAMMLSDSFEGRLQRLELLAMNDQMLELFNAEYASMLEMLRDDLRSVNNIHDILIVLSRGNQLQALLKQHVTWVKQTYPADYEQALNEYHQETRLQ